MTEGIKLTSMFILSACDLSGTGLGPYVLNHLICTKILLFLSSPFYR